MAFGALVSLTCSCSVWNLSWFFWKVSFPCSKHYIDTTSKILPKNKFLYSLFWPMGGWIMKLAYGQWVSGWVWNHANEILLIIEVSQKSCRHVLSDKGYDSARYVLRASPVVFNILHYTSKLDEEKSKYADLAQQNGFGPAFLHSLLRLVRCACERRV